MKKDKKKKIKRVIELVYTSAFLKNEKPLSLFLIAPPEQSKTYFLMDKTTKYVHYSTDLSFMGLIKILQNYKEIKQIIIPDFLKITQKKQSTKNNLLTLLNGYLEEGIFEINLGNSERINLKGRKGGIITSTTKTSFIQNRKIWEATGFSSRFIVLTWKYSEKTLNELLTLINEEISSNNKEPTKINYEITEVKSSKEINCLLNPLADGSPRKLKNLQTLLKAIALSYGRNYTLRKDVQELKELSEFMNFRFNEI
jgi:hypothetical protein